MSIMHLSFSLLFLILVDLGIHQVQSADTEERKIFKFTIRHWIDNILVLFLLV